MNIFSISCSVAWLSPIGFSIPGVKLDVPNAINQIIRVTNIPLGVSTPVNAVVYHAKPSFHKTEEPFLEQNERNLLNHRNRTRYGPGA